MFKKIVLAFSLLAGCYAGDNQGHKRACAPLTCAEQGATCGATDDGCGGELHCGVCGIPGVCVDRACVATFAACVPKTCAEVGATCGATDDGCGGAIQCGTCSPGTICINRNCQ